MCKQLYQRKDKLAFCGVLEDGKNFEKEKTKNKKDDNHKNVIDQTYLLRVVLVDECNRLVDVQRRVVSDVPYR